MAFRFPCPTCKRELSGPDSIAGGAARCPVCKAIVLVGEPLTSPDTGVIPKVSRANQPPSVAAEKPGRQPTLDDDDAPFVLRSSEEPLSSWLGLLTLLLLFVLVGLGAILAAALL